MNKDNDDDFGDDDYAAATATVTEKFSKSSCWRSLLNFWITVDISMTNGCELIVREKVKQSDLTIEDTAKNLL